MSEKKKKYKRPPSRPTCKHGLEVCDECGRGRTVA